MKEANIITHLKQMHCSGYLADELDEFIDDYLILDEITEEVQIVSSGKLVQNQILIEIVQLSNSMYDSSEVDKLIAKL